MLKFKNIRMEVMNSVAFFGQIFAHFGQFIREQEQKKGQAVQPAL